MERRHNAARLEQFDDDMLRGQFIGNRLGKAFKGELGRDIHRAVGQAENTATGTDVQNHPPTLLAEYRNDSLDHIDNAENIHIIIFANLFDGHPFNHTVLAVTCVVDDHVNSAKSFQCHGQRAFDGGGVFDIQPHNPQVRNTVQPMGGIACR